MNNNTKRRRKKKIVKRTPSLVSKRYRTPEDVKYKKDKSKLYNFDNNILLEKKKYPWDEWMDGGWWSITRGKDYVIDTYNMIKGLHVKGLRTGYRVNTIYVSKYEIWFRFYTGYLTTYKREDLGLDAFVNQPLKSISRGYR